jgi:hypothetical protein
MSAGLLNNKFYDNGREDINRGNRKLVERERGLLTLHAATAKEHETPKERITLCAV